MTNASLWWELNPIGLYIRNLLLAYNSQPSRHSLYKLRRHYDFAAMMEWNWCLGLTRVCRLCGGVIFPYTRSYCAAMHTLSSCCADDWVVQRELLLHDSSRLGFFGGTCDSCAWKMATGFSWQTGGEVATLFRVGGEIRAWWVGTNSAYYFMPLHRNLIHHQISRFHHPL